MSKRGTDGMWSRHGKTLVLAFTLTLGVGCGDELADTTYPGEPRFEIKGTIESLARGKGIGTNYVGIIWANWAKNGDTVASQLVELGNERLPFEYRVRAFDVPDSNGLNDLDGILFGTGFVVLFEDEDGDRSLFESDDGPDTVRGLATKHVVFYIEKVTPEARSRLMEWGRIRNLDALKDGYNLMRTVCQTDPDEIFDDLEVVENEPVPIVTAEESPEQEDDLRCMDFY